MMGQTHLDFKEKLFWDFMSAPPTKKVGDLVVGLLVEITGGFGKD